MSLAFKVDVTDHATPAIEAKLAQCSPARLRAIVGPACARHVRSHLLGNGTNKRGWPSTHFWADAARSTSWFANAGDQLVIISVNKIGVRQRYYGGRIAPVKAKALAIPISPVSYGHVPSDFTGLFLLKTKKGAYLCDRGEQVSEKTGRLGRRQVGGNKSRQLKSNLVFLFKLAGSVTQAADPSVVPSADELMQVAMSRIEEAVQ
ncbi:MAG: hypothetical protein WCH99_10045 [Verrucomicrobiota bacterium]